MSGTTSYNNDKVVSGEVEYPANDPASGAFFQPDFKKNDDLKMMLDGSKDSLKLEAMKRIIGMIAKGRDASDLFPAVVKNVVSKNIEVKKLVYLYLVRYAEEQQDLALLSISTFQRALKDPNQLIRASALRVLSSIRVPMIVPIVMLAIRDSSSDMSPYVRKTAAHAIPKLYSLDPEQKEELVLIIKKLLSDKAPLVVGSAAMAFLEVCGDRMSLIHQSYRKLCSLLADVDEWGQLALLNVLTVYARTCFPDPNNEEYSSDSETDKPFYDTDSDENGTPQKKSSHSPTLDADHRLLLRAAKPLLQSRNSGVVIAVAQLFYHCGPAQELPPVAKAMIRLLRAPIEVQSVVLNSISSLTATKKSLFEPYLKSFFVRNSDPLHIKLLKMSIMTNLATEASAPVVLREFQTYVTAGDRKFAAGTIHAIGRLAVSVQTETETCLNGLLHLLSSKDEWLVCEAVVVVKRVVGGGAASARAVVARAAKLLRADRLVGQARAAAVWLVAEHGAKHPRAAAVLAHMAVKFVYQDELVKLQLLSLAVKLSITQPETAPMCRYVASLARYDASYDVRDRARLLRRFIEPTHGSQLAQYAAAIFCADKPKPAVTNNLKDLSQYTMGTLSQYIGCAANGYRPLPPAPLTAQPASLRDAPDLEYTPITTTNNTTSTTSSRTTTLTQDTQKNKSFYSEPESSGSGSVSSSSSGSSGSEESSDEESSSETKKKEEKIIKESNNYRTSNSGSGTSDSDPDSSSSSEETDSDESNETSAEETVQKKKNNTDDSKAEKEKAVPNPSDVQAKNEKSNLELLLELDEVASSLPTMTPTCGGFLTPQSFPAPIGSGDVDGITPVGPSLSPTVSTEMISRVVSGGLAASRRWTRAPHLFSHKMCAIEVTFTNGTAQDINNIRVNKKTLTGSRSFHDFAHIPVLGPNSSAPVTLGVDFADTIQPVEFTVLSSLGEVSVSITPPVGELIRSVTMSEQKWDLEHKKLRGMNECDKKAPRMEDDEAACKRVLETANLGVITPTGDFLRFAGRMMSSQDLVLLSVRLDGDSARVTSNCPNMAIASLLANEIAQAVSRS